MAADGSVVIEIKGDAADFESALHEILQSAQRLSSMLGGVGDFAAGSFTEMAGAGEKLGKSLSSAAEGAEDLSGAAREAGVGLEGVSDSAEDAGASLGSFDSLFQSSFLANLASEAINAVTQAVKEFIQNIVEAGKAFTSSMSQVAATMGMTAAEINSGSEAYTTLQEAAKEAGETTVFSATEAAEALNYLALAGYDAEKAAEALPAVLNLAAAGNLDLAYASDLATDAMAALGIEASNKALTQFGDQMAKTASKANTSVAQLGEAILTVGGTAKSLAGGTKELNAALGVLANRGIKGAEGGTHLRNVILSLSSPTDQARKSLEKLGVSVYDADGSMRSLNDIFQDLDVSLRSLSESEKANVLSEIFNRTDLAAVQALLAGCGEEFDSLALAIENSGGAMQDMADTQLNNLEGDLKLLDSAMEGLYLSIYETLEPALRGLAQALTQVVGSVSEWVERFPWMVDVIAGAAAGIVALTAALVAYKVATMIATTVTKAFAAATGLALGPVTLIVAAIGALIGLVVGLEAAYREANPEIYGLVDASDALVDSLKGQKQAFEELTASIHSEYADTSALIGALDALAGKESKTAADKAAILGMVEKLNAAIPGLSLAYNEEADRLYDLSTGATVTAASLQALADAHKNEQLSAANSEHYQELLTAQERLREQMDATKEAMREQGSAYLKLDEQGRVCLARSNLLLLGMDKGVQDLSESLVKMKMELDDTTADLIAYSSVSTAAEVALKALSDAGESLADSADGAGREIEESIKTLAELQAEYEQATAQSLALTDETDRCAAAFAQQADQGSLSLDTILELIDAGYAAALAVDEETGAVTLNKDAYIAIAQAKLEAQIQTLEAQKASVDAAIDLKKEAIAAKYAAVGHRENAAAIKYENEVKSDPDIDALEAEAAAYDAQIAALKASIDTLSSYSGAVTSTARSTSSASKAAKTQAEKDLESFQKIQSELDHLRTMDEISEEEYYGRLQEARDRYLTDDANLDQHRKITEELHKLDKQFAEQERKTWEDLKSNLDSLESDYQSALEGVRDVVSEELRGVKAEYESALNDLQRAQASMADKLADTDLFTSHTDKYSGRTTYQLADYQAQIDQINAYRDALQALKDRGVDGGLMREITDLSLEDAMSYAKLLTKMTDKELDDYLALYEEKQTAAAQVAEEFYAPEIEALSEKKEESIAGVLDSLPQDLRSIGEEAAAELAQGWNDKKEEAVAAVRDTKKQLEEELAKITEMLQGSVLAETLSYSSKLEFNTSAAAEKKSVESGKQAEQLAEHTALMNAGGPGGDLVMTIDGIEFARIEMPYWRQVEDQSPRIVSD